MVTSLMSFFCHKQAQTCCGKIGILRILNPTIGCFANRWTSVKTDSSLWLEVCESYSTAKLGILGS